MPCQESQRELWSTCPSIRSAAPEGLPTYEGDGADHDSGYSLKNLSRLSIRYFACIELTYEDPGPAEKPGCARHERDTVREDSGECASYGGSPVE